MKLIEICDKVIEQAEKATPRPWHIYKDKFGWVQIDNHEHLDIAYLRLGNEREADGPIELNADYIVTSANHAETLARAVKVLVEALKHEAEDLHSGYTKASPYCQCNSHAALREAEAIVGGGE